MNNLTEVQLIYAVVLLIFGCVMGSFLNVVIYRLPRNKSLAFPGSFCPKCLAKIAFYDNIPILSWLILKGKCRNCKTSIHWRYPFVELLTGLLWSLQGWCSASYTYGIYTNTFLTVFYLLFISALVVVIFIDFDWQIIPDEINLGGIILALLASTFIPALNYADNLESYWQHYPELFPLTYSLPLWLCSLITSLIGLLVGSLLLILVNLMGCFLFKKQIKQAQLKDPEIDSAIGFGDVKLMGLAGAVEGWKAIFIIFIIACFTGAIGGILSKFFTGTPNSSAGFLSSLKNRWQTGNTVIAFGPFIVLGILAMHFAHEEIFHFLNHLFSF